MFLYTPKYLQGSIDKTKCRASVSGEYRNPQSYQCNFKAKHFKNDVGLCTKHAKKEGWLDKDNLVSKWIGRVDKYGDIKIGKIKFFESTLIYTFRKGSQELIGYSSKLKKVEWEKHLFNLEKEAVIAISERLKDRVRWAKIELKERKDQYSKWLEDN